MIELDLHSRLPIYEQLKNKICELAMMGELEPGDQLPSVRGFARDVGVNPNTVQKAYQELEREGIIVSVTGKGSFLSEQFHLKLHLERNYLKKLTQLVHQARRCGITSEQVMDTVRQAFEEEQA